MPILHGSGMVPPLLNILRLVLGPALVLSFINEYLYNYGCNQRRHLVHGVVVICCLARYQRVLYTNDDFTQNNVPTRCGLYSAPVNGSNETSSRTVCFNLRTDASTSTLASCMLNDFTSTRQSLTVNSRRFLSRFRGRAHRIRDKSQWMRASRIFIANSPLHSTRGD